MGDFTQVSVGDGILKLDGTDAGFIRNVNFNRTLTQLKLETGNPKRLQGTAPVKEEVFISAEFLELSMTNFSRFMGIPAVVVTDDPVTISDGANQEKTFAASGDYAGALERIFLDGINVASLVIKNVAEAVTYVEGTDYILDGTGRGVIRLEGGDIASGQTVRVSYTYTPVVSTKIRGGESFDFQRFSIEFRHPKIKAAKDLVIHHSIVEPSPNFAMNFNADGFIANNVQFDFIYDPTRAGTGNSMFTIEEVDTGEAVSV